MEAVTAFVEGPLCFVILFGMLKQKPWRFTLQFAVSLGQLYGDVLYFATSWYDGMLVFCCYGIQHRYHDPCILPPTLCTPVYLEPFTGPVHMQHMLLLQGVSCSAIC